MSTKSENYDLVAEVAEAKVQRALLRYEYITYKTSSEAEEHPYLDFE